MAAKLVAEVLDGQPLQVIYRDHHDLLASGLFMGREHSFELIAAAGVEQSGIVHHPASQGREARLGTQRRDDQ
ncbi:hypothetical protein D3C75_1046060 [compost metagenome]